MVINGFPVSASVSKEFRSHHSRDNNKWLYKLKIDDVSWICQRTMEIGTSGICSPVHVTTNSETRAVPNCEGTQEKENRNTLKILKTVFLSAKDSGKLKHFLF